MSHLATQRLRQASAALEPADRALLNLWVNRGLDDEQLADLTGMTADAVRARRDGIVSALSRELHLPESEIRATIDHIEPTVGELSSPIPDPQLEDENVDDASSAPVAPSAAATPVSSATPPPPATRRRRRGAMIGAAVVATVVIIVAVVLLASGSSHTTTRVALSSPAATPSTPASPTTAGSSTVTTSASATATTPATATSGTDALAALPGGLRHASGSVVLTGSKPHLKLRLTVNGLPPVHGGHYEAWLFTSVVDSRALGKVPAGSHTLSLPLPAGARGYHLIDISFQPTGVTAQSGESELQARNPVDGP